MTLQTLLLFLIGDADAIRAVAADGSALWIGLLLVLSAGLARSYDARDLLRQPGFLLLPLAASLPLALVFVLFLQLLAANTSGTMPPMLASMQSFLGLFWLTAPLAWLYAVPYGRFLRSDVALRARLVTLALVALWRVALLIRVVTLLLDGNVRTAACAVLLVADVAMLAGLAMDALRSAAAPSTPTLFQVMGGVRPQEVVEDVKSQDLLNWLGCLAVALGVLTLPLWLIGSFSFPVHGRDWQTMLIEPATATPSTGLWVVASGASVFFLLILPWTQPAHRRATLVERLLKTGQITAALEYLSSRSPRDFPPGWQPPPTSDFNASPRLLDILNTLQDRHTPPWVRALYVKRFRHYLTFPLWFWYYDDELEQVVRILQRLPEGRELAQVALEKMKQWRISDAPKEFLEGSDERLGGVLLPEPRLTERRPELVAALRGLAR